jgi:hypothetical protein
MLAPWLVATCLAGPAAAAEPVRDLMIVPGERVGPISLGMNAAALAQIVGPQAPLWQGGDTIYSFGQIAAEIGDKSPGVDTITVNDPRYETESHIRVGLAPFVAERVLGQPAKKTTASGLDTIDYEGISLVVRNNIVVQIRIHK